MSEFDDHTESLGAQPRGAKWMRQWSASDFPNVNGRGPVCGAVALRQELAGSQPSQRPRNNPPRTPRTTACPVLLPSCRAKLLAKVLATLSDRDARAREVERPTRVPV